MHVFHNSQFPKNVNLMTSQWHHILLPSTSHLAYATFITIIYNIWAFQTSRYAQSLTLSVASFVKLRNFLEKNVYTKLRFSRWRNEIIKISGSALESSNDCLPSVVDLFLSSEQNLLPKNPPKKVWFLANLNKIIP